MLPAFIPTQLVLALSALRIAKFVIRPFDSVVELEGWELSSSLIGCSRSFAVL